MKQKVIIIIHTDYPSKEGMSYRVHQMAYRLAIKYDVTVVAPILENSSSALRESSGSYEILRVPIPLYVPERVKSNRLLLRLVFMIFFTFSMVRVWKSVSISRVKLIQAEQQLSLLPALVLSLLLKVPLIVDDALAFEKYYEHYPKYIKSVAWMFEMLLFHSCRLIISSSWSAGQSFPEAFKISPSKIKIVPNGVESVSVLNQRAETNKGSKDVVFTASMYSPQNLRAITNLVKIFTDVSREIETARLFIIGGPTHMLGDEYLKDIKKLHNVFILGRMSEQEKNRYLRSAKVCPLPFDPKDKLMGGVRLKSLECLAQGKVVISTSSGVEGIIGAIDGVNLIISDNFAEFKKHMVDVLKHPDKYEEIQRNAVQLADKYQWENILQPYLSIVESI